MATITVSTQAQFLASLATVKAGDTIKLAAGNYGSVTLDASQYATRYLKYAGEVKIVSASATDKAVFSKLTVTGATNLTFENIKFDSTGASQAVVLNSAKSVTIRGATFDGDISGGYGTGVGLKVSQGQNVLIENSTFANFRKGVEGWKTDGLTIQNSKLQNISYDGIVTGHVQGLKLVGNTIAMNSNPAEDIHRDGIQIYNQGTTAPSSNILISGNKITATDQVTHGIYIDNADARSTGARGEYFSNITITDNTVQTSQKLGIAVAFADTVKISGNTLIQNDAMNDNKSAITIPLIHVEVDSTNVTVTNNIVHGAPLVTNASWQAIAGAETNWTVSGNEIVKLSWKIGESTSDPYADIQGNGEADAFRFKGTAVASGGKTDAAPDVNFGEGDTITLINYQANTFKGVWQGNKLDVNATGDYVKINSIVDLQELAATSPKVSASVSGDTLTLHITQTGGVHDIVLEGLGQEYHDTYDSTLF